MPQFNGFSKNMPQFFKALSKNNSKEWFEAHRNEYEKDVKLASQEFVSAMGKKLESPCPAINAIPKINKSLFRLNRDTRFSPDKSPYKTNLGILFWDGPAKRMETSGFYFHVEEDDLMLGCGRHVLTPKALNQFRKKIVDKKAAAALAKVVDELSTRGYRIGTQHYKRIPRGFGADNDFQNEYLRYNSLTARIDMPIPGELFSPQAVDFVFGHFEAMLPLHKWLMKYLS